MSPHISEYYWMVLYGILSFMKMYEKVCFASGCEVFSYMKLEWGQARQYKAPRASKDNVHKHIYDKDGHE